MPPSEKFENLVVGSGVAGRRIAGPWRKRAGGPRWSNGEPWVARVITWPAFPARTSSILQRWSRSPDGAGSSV